MEVDLLLGVSTGCGLVYNGCMGSGGWSLVYPGIWWLVWRACFSKLSKHAQLEYYTPFTLVLNGRKVEVLRCGGCEVNVSGTSEVL